MKQIPKVYPVVTVTIVTFGPKPKSRKPTAVLVKAELHEGEEINDLGQRIHHLERAREILQDHIKMYHRWQEQDEIVKVAHETE